MKEGTEKELAAIRVVTNGRLDKSGDRDDRFHPGRQVDISSFAEPADQPQDPGREEQLAQLGLAAALRLNQSAQ